jgi:hypothetical protein
MRKKSCHVVMRIEVLAQTSRNTASSGLAQVYALTSTGDIFLRQQGIQGDKQIQTKIVKFHAGFKVSIIPITLYPTKRFWGRSERATPG